MPMALRKDANVQSILLVTKRKWNWRVFLVLLGLIIPAVFAILPFEISRQRTYTGADLIASLGWEIILLDRLINILLVALMGAVGLVLANRIGLGLPFVEAWTRHEPIAYRFQTIVATAWITAVLLELSSLLARTFVIDPPMNSLFEQLGITTPSAAAAPPLHGFLASISAGINEEIQFRLFGLSLLAWLGGLLFHDPSGRPKAIVLWAANILLAVGFGAAHLPTAATLGLPMNALVIGSTLFVNGIAGLAFGWLFWTFGLESAILAHCLADVIAYTLIPLITMQDGELATSLATAAVAAFILVAVFWAGRCLVTQGRVHNTRMTC